MKKLFIIKFSFAIIFFSCANDTDVVSLTPTGTPISTVASTLTPIPTSTPTPVPTPTPTPVPTSTPTPILSAAEEHEISRSRNFILDDETTHLGPYLVHYSIGPMTLSVGDSTTIKVTMEARSFDSKEEDHDVLIFWNRPNGEENIVLLEGKHDADCNGGRCKFVTTFEIPDHPDWQQKGIYTIKKIVLTDTYFMQHTTFTSVDHDSNGYTSDGKELRDKLEAGPDGNGFNFALLQDGIEIDTHNFNFMPMIIE